MARGRCPLSTQSGHSPTAVHLCIRCRDPRPPGSAGPTALARAPATAAPSSSVVKGFVSTAAPGTRSPSSTEVAVTNSTAMRRQLQMVWTAATPQPCASRTSDVMRSGQRSVADRTASVSVAAMSIVRKPHARRQSSMNKAITGSSSMMRAWIACLRGSGSAMSLSRRIPSAAGDKNPMRVRPKSSIGVRT